MENIVNKIIKISLYLLVFLLPIFFLPLTIFPVALNKQLLLVGICFLTSVLWLVKIIKTGKINLTWNKISLAVLILFVVLGISTFFSMAKTQSFWGMNVEPNTLFSFILYGLVFFLFSNLISKQEAFKAVKIFLLSSGILALFFLIQEIFNFTFPWNFAKANGFNPIGTVQGLTVFFGGAFVVLITLLMITDKRSKAERISIWVIGGLLFISILFINFWVAWLGIVFAMVMILWTKLKSLSPKESIGMKDYFLPLFIFAIALILIFIKLPLGNILDLPVEINLTYKASFDIAKKTLGEGAKALVLGSGPATFGYDYSLHRSANINLTDFWYLRFPQAPSALITSLATFGILGILAILFLIITFFHQGIKSFSSNKSKLVKVNGMQAVVFVGGAYFLFLWIFYAINFSLIFVGFLMMGLYLASLNKSKEISLVNPPQKAFFSMLGAIILIVVLIAGFYIYIQKYDAAISFARGINLLNAEQPDLDQGIKNIGRAANLAKTNDNYYRNLSQVLLFKITEVLNDQSLSQEARQTELQGHISNIQKVVQKTIEVNPKNSPNWVQTGQIYENLITLIDNADQLAILSYKEAEKLDPQNPQIPFNIGRVYMAVAYGAYQGLVELSQADVKDEEKENQFEFIYAQGLELAIDNFQKSIELKYNFTPAYYLLAQVYEMKEEKELAIQNYQAVLQLEPGNEEVRERIEELTK